jgi:hypothetical protein
MGSAWLTLILGGIRAIVELVRLIAIFRGPNKDPFDCSTEASSLRQPSFLGALNERSDNVGVRVDPASDRS